MRGNLVVILLVWGRPLCYCHDFNSSLFVCRRCSASDSPLQQQQQQQQPSLGGGGGFSYVNDQLISVTSIPPQFTAANQWVFLAASSSVVCCFVMIRRGWDESVCYLMHAGRICLTETNKRIWKRRSIIKIFSSSITFQLWCRIRLLRVRRCHRKLEQAICKYSVFLFCLFHFIQFW